MSLVYCGLRQCHVLQMMNPDAAACLAGEQTLLGQPDNVVIRTQSWE